MNEGHEPHTFKVTIPDQGRDIRTGSKGHVRQVWGCVCQCGYGAGETFATETGALADHGDHVLAILGD